MSNKVFLWHRYHTASSTPPSCARIAHAMLDGVPPTLSCPFSTTCSQCFLWTRNIGKSEYRRTLRTGGSQCSQHSLPSVHLFRLPFPAFHVFMFPVFSSVPSAYAQQFLYSRATMRNLNAHAWLSIITPRGGQRVCDSIRVPSFPPVPVSPVFVVVVTRGIVPLSDPWDT